MNLIIAIVAFLSFAQAAEEPKKPAKERTISMVVKRIDFICSRCVILFYLIFLRMSLKGSFTVILFIRSKPSPDITA